MWAVLLTCPALSRGDQTSSPGAAPLAPPAGGVMHPESQLPVPQAMVEGLSGLPAGAVCAQATTLQLVLPCSSSPVIWVSGQGGPSYLDTPWPHDGPHTLCQICRARRIYGLPHMLARPWCSSVSGKPHKANRRSGETRIVVYPRAGRACYIWPRHHALSLSSWLPFLA